VLIKLRSDSGQVRIRIRVQGDYTESPLRQARSLHLPRETRTTRIPTPALPTPALHTARHTDQVGGIRGTCRGDIGIGDRGGDTALAPLAIECSRTRTGILSPGGGDGIVPVAFGVDDSCGVSCDAGREIDRMGVRTGTGCVHQIGTRLERIERGAVGIVGGLREVCSGDGVAGNGSSLGKGCIERPVICAACWRGGECCWHGSKGVGIHFETSRAVSHKREAAATWEVREPIGSGSERNGSCHILCVPSGRGNERSGLRLERSGTIAWTCCIVDTEAQIASGGRHVE